MTSTLAKQNGTHVYDKPHDILIFKIDDRDYLESLEFDEFVIDMDTEGHLTGLRIFDATRILQLPSDTLGKIRRFTFVAEADHGVITVRLRFTAAGRGGRGTVQHSHNFVREAPDPVDNTATICTVS